MIENPNNTLNDGFEYLKIDQNSFDAIIDQLVKMDYIILTMAQTYLISIDGYEFKYSYKSNRLKYIFRNYIFQIILTLLTFLLGLISGLMLK